MAPSIFHGFSRAGRLFCPALALLFCLFISTAPAFAAAEPYLAGGGGANGLDADDQGVWLPAPQGISGTGAAGVGGTAGGTVGQVYNALADALPTAGLGSPLSGGGGANGGPNQGGGGGGAGVVQASGGVLYTNGENITGGNGGNGGQDNLAGNGGAGLFMAGGNAAGTALGTLPGGRVEVTSASTIMGGNGGDVYGSDLAGVTAGYGGAGVLGNNAFVANSGTIIGGNGGDVFDGTYTLGRAGGYGGHGVAMYGASADLRFLVTNDGDIFGGKGGNGGRNDAAGMDGGYGSNGGSGVYMQGFGLLNNLSGATLTGGLGGSGGDSTSGVLPGNGGWASRGGDGASFEYFTGQGGGSVDILNAGDILGGTGGNGGSGQNGSAGGVGGLGIYLGEVQNTTLNNLGGTIQGGNGGDGGTGIGTDGDGGAAGDGLEAFESQGLSVINSGTIKGGNSGSGNANSQNGGGYGIYINSSDAFSLVNTATGVIIGGNSSDNNGNGGTALYVYNGDLSFNITNAGNITGGNAYAGNNGSGGRGAYLYAEGGVFTNTGTISGGLGSDGSRRAALEILGSNNTLNFGGKFVGSVDLSWADNLTVNAQGADIDGDLSLGGAETSFNFDLSGANPSAITLHGGVIAGSSGSTINITGGYAGLHTLFSGFNNLSTTGFSLHTDVTSLWDGSGTGLDQIDPTKVTLTLLKSGQSVFYWRPADGDHSDGWSDANWTTPAHGFGQNWGIVSPAGSVGVFETATNSPLSMNGGLFSFDTLQFLAGADGITINGPGGLIIRPASGNYGVIAVDGTGTEVTINAPITEDLTPMGLIKAGEGWLVLGGTNSYTGATSLQGGWLSISQADNLGTGNLSFDGGNLHVSDEVELGTRTVALNKAAGIEVEGGKYLALENAVTGSATLTKSGAGDLAFLYANNPLAYTGKIIVEEGTLGLGASHAAGSGDIALATGTTLLIAPDEDGTYAFGNNVTGYEGGEGDVLVETTYTSSIINWTGSITANSIEVKSGHMNLAALETGSITITSGLSLNVDTLRFSNSRSLNGISADPGEFTWTNLDVIGQGNQISNGIDLGSFASGPGKLTFTLDDTVAANSTLLTNDAGNTPFDLSNYTLALTANNSFGGFVVGDSLTLMSNTVNDVANAGQDYRAAAGATTYVFNRDDTDMANLILGLTAIQLTGGSGGPAKAYLEGGAASLNFVAHNGILAATRGMDEAVAATLREPGVGAFASLSGTTERIDTGSHVDVDGLSLMAGLVWRFDNNLGQTRVGFFAEGGWGSYDTYNSFSTGSIEGDGDITHYGLGLLFRQDFNRLGSGTPYAEATVRAGRVETDFDSGDFATDTGFDISAPYYGGHVGLGYILPVTEQGKLDLYAKGFWTRQEGDSDTTDAGERLKIDDADSLATRVGARYSQDFAPGFTAYIGAAWEYEFDGQVDGTLNGFNVDAPDAKGSSAFGEIGLTYSPAESNWNIGLAAHGNLGVREGGGLTLNVGYEF